MVPSHLKILLEGIQLGSDSNIFGENVKICCKGGQISVNLLLLASISHHWLVEVLKENWTQSCSLIMPSVNLRDLATFMTQIQTFKLDLRDFRRLESSISNLSHYFDLSRLSAHHEMEGDILDDTSEDHMTDKSIEENFTDQEGRLVCLVCYKMFKNDGFDQFRIHMKSHPKSLIDKIDPKPDMKCEECGFTSDTLEGKVAHLKSHKAKSYECQFCLRTFQSQKMLSSHDKSGMCQKAKRFCTLCQKTFCDSTRLKYHTKTVHGGQKPWSCSICDKTFTELRSLKEHQHIHAQERPFPCQRCDKKFVQKNHLTYHLASKHGIGSSHCCKKCSKAFAFPFQLKKHVATCHANK